MNISCGYKFIWKGETSLKCSHKLSRVATLEFLASCIYLWAGRNSCWYKTPWVSLRLWSLLISPRRCSLFFCTLFARLKLTQHVYNTKNWGKTLCYNGINFFFLTNRYLRKCHFLCLVWPKFLLKQHFFLSTHWMKNGVFCQGGSDPVFIWNQFFGVKNVQNLWK